MNKMPYYKTIRAGIISLMGMVFFFVVPLYSVELMEFEKQMAQEYEMKISSGDPVSAGNFLADEEFKEKYLLVDKKKSSILIAKSQAVIDLNKIFDFVWNEANFNKLSDALGERINEKENILCSMGFGPQPEKLLPWIKKYRVDYKKENILIVKKAIREWDIVFSTSINKINVDWGQASKDRGDQKIITKEEWNKWNIRQRTSALFKLTKTEGWKDFDSFIPYNEKQENIQNKYYEKLDVVQDVQVFLDADQKSQLDTLLDNDASINEQMLFLGKLFNGNAIEGKPADFGKIEALKAKVNSFRESSAKEDISLEQIDILNDMLKTSVMTNIKDTAVGKKITEFYAEKKLNMEIKDEMEDYGGYDPKSGKISINSGLVREFMRVKGYSAESLMTNKDQIDEVAKYISPAFVHQVGIQMQDAWAKDKGVYKPLNQEDKINASAMEAIYTLEKVKKDKKFRGIFKDFSEISDSSYAGKVTQNAKFYAEEGSTQFNLAMSRLHYSDLPSAQAASSKIINAINNELERREGLSKDKKARVEKKAYIGEERAFSMDSFELLSSLRFINKGALAKISDSLLAADYAKHYQSATADNNLMFGLSKKNVKVSVPPLAGVNQ